MAKGAQKTEAKDWVVIAKETRNEIFSELDVLLRAVDRFFNFESLRNFMLYFESFTFKLLRYGDYEEFVSFFKEMLSFKKERSKV